MHSPQQINCTFHPLLESHSLVFQTCHLAFYNLQYRISLKFKKTDIAVFVAIFLLLVSMFIDKVPMVNKLVNLNKHKIIYNLSIYLIKN